VSWRPSQFFQAKQHLRDRDITAPPKQKVFFRRTRVGTNPNGRAIPGAGDLCRKSEVTDEEIKQATEADLKDETAKPFAFKSGHTVDMAKAIETHPQAKTLLADKATIPGLRRTMVMTALIRGFPD